MVALSWALETECKSLLGCPYCTGNPQRFGLRCFDCSGYGVRVVHDTFGITMPFSTSADAARFAEAHPAYLLHPAVAQHIPFTIGIAGGINGYGAAGHFWFWGPNGLTYESRGSKGVSRVPHADRLRIATHSLYIPGVVYNPGATMDGYTDDDRKKATEVWAALYDGSRAGVLHDLIELAIVARDHLGDGSKPGPLHDLVDYNAQRNINSDDPRVPHRGETFRIRNMHTIAAKDKGWVRTIGRKLGLQVPDPE